MNKLKNALKFKSKPKVKSLNHTQRKKESFMTDYEQEILSKHANPNTNNNNNRFTHQRVPTTRSKQVSNDSESSIGSEYEFSVNENTTTSSPDTPQTQSWSTNQFLLDSELLTSGVVNYGSLSGKGKLLSHQQSTIPLAPSISDHAFFKTESEDQFFQIISSVELPMSIVYQIFKDVILVNLSLPEIIQLIHYNIQLDQILIQLFQDSTFNCNNDCQLRIESGSEKESIPIDMNCIAPDHLKTLFEFLTDANVKAKKLTLIDCSPTFYLDYNDGFVLFLNECFNEIAFLFYFLKPPMDFHIIPEHFEYGS
ncbi:unnamed protein product [Ambrosiozyma monospora]|uniref:Unnamed protein product n=1 Tax=Ambrosiozyma monospora TaxID=43982 RepID=A0ACB5TL13_AMBMO|nr:unnamed protein product [Ambrosiozyma monospora]